MDFSAFGLIEDFFDDAAAYYAALGKITDFFTILAKFALGDFSDLSSENALGSFFDGSGS
ncbi:hypothetical protein [Corynebacterium terpenotabidum]|uniref:hypothetical protein n=1 Tax=Corynebacterium terpenotabidum TaxID=89154 RepID=UPI00040E8EF4|nr:hypothetical protein [Corynebacterium terpenotabidum]